MCSAVTTPAPGTSLWGPVSPEAHPTISSPGFLARQSWGNSHLPQPLLGYRRPETHTLSPATHTCLTHMQHHTCRHMKEGNQHHHGDPLTNGPGHHHTAAGTLTHPSLWTPTLSLSGVLKPALCLQMHPSSGNAPMPTDLPWQPVPAGREADRPGVLPVRPGHPPGWGCACTAPVWGAKAGGVEADCPVLSSRQPRALLPALRPPLQGPFSHSGRTLPGLEMGHC